MAQDMYAREELEDGKNSTVTTPETIINSGAVPATRGKPMGVDEINIGKITMPPRM